MTSSALCVVSIYLPVWGIFSFSPCIYSPLASDFQGSDSFLSISMCFLACGSDMFTFVVMLIFSLILLYITSRY